MSLCRVVSLKIWYSSCAFFSTVFFSFFFCQKQNKWNYSKYVDVNTGTFWCCQAELVSLIHAPLGILFNFFYFLRFSTRISTLFTDVSIQIYDFLIKFGNFMQKFQQKSVDFMLKSRYNRKNGIIAFHIILWLF